MAPGTGEARGIDFERVLNAQYADTAVCVPTSEREVVVLHVDAAGVAVDEGGSIHIDNDWDVDLSTCSTGPVTLIFVLDSAYDPNSEIDVLDSSAFLTDLTATRGMFEYTTSGEAYLEFHITGPGSQAPTIPITIRTPELPNPEPT